MNYTEEQFNALAQYEEQFKGAVEHNYVRGNPGSKALDGIRDILVAAKNLRHYPRNWGCSACVVDLFKDAGRLWLEDADARAAAELTAAAKAEAEKPETEQAPAPAPETEAEKPEDGAKDQANLSAKPKTGKTPAKKVSAKKTAS